MTASASSPSVPSSSESPASDSPRPRAGRTAAGKRKLRRTLTHAAIDLFLSHGFDTTTVDDIAAAAGVGRRTFFRYFRSKEDSIFPNHDDLIADLEAALAESDPDAEDPVDAVCRAVRLVLDSYLDDPDVSLKRYRLTRAVPSLRDKEVASVDRYQRVFTRFLRERFDAGGDPTADMRAPIIGAAVAAAHNHVLRQWLHSGGAVDAHRLADRAFAMVRLAGTPHPNPRGAPASADDDIAADAEHTAGADAAAGDPTGKSTTTDSTSTGSTSTGSVVAVVRTSAPASDVVRRINAALGDDADTVAADPNGTECH